METVNSYEERKQARIDRLRERANRMAKESDALCDEALNMSKAIPMGQPILVGHHSEKADRRYRGRIDKKMSKAVDTHNYSKELERRAQAAENNNAIMSDDPQACEKLQAKIDKITESIELSKKVNALMRKQKTYAQALEHFEAQDDELSQRIAKGLKRQYGFYAIPPERIRAYYWDTTGHNAEKRRLEKRLKFLQASKENGPIEFTVIDEAGYSLAVSENEGRVVVEFPYKPDAETRKKLKSYPITLKWSRYAQAWVRKKTPSCGSYFVSELKKALEESKED